MKKLILIAIVALLFNGCRYIKTKDSYVDAKVASELKIPSGTDKPNAASALTIPDIAGENKITEKSNPAPPDMPIRTRQTENGKVKIENQNGFPVLTANVDKQEMWNAIKNIKLANWQISDNDEASCIANLQYIDQAAKEREDDGFIKKIFRRDSYYADFSGAFQMSCKQIGNSMQVKFTKLDGTAAKSFLADNIMNKLYEYFSK